MKSNIFCKPFMALTISLIILIFLYLPIFYTNYAYLDEIHQLWNNQDNSNYNMFFVQGRWLSGIFFNTIFARINNISDLKITRIISFFLWFLFLVEYFRIGKKWQYLIGFEPILLNLSGIYIACSISVAIYLGWGSCFEVGLATLLGLWSGHLFFEQFMLYKNWTSISKLSISLGIIAGVCCLFMYQISFGTFFIPFVLYLIHKKTNANYKILFLGFSAYFVTTIIYYFLFLLSLKIAAVPASPRTSFSFDIVGKLGFFFGYPLAQAFSFNFLYNVHTILSQAFPIVMMVCWVLIFWKKDKNTINKKISFLLFFIGLCMLIYLPLLISKENFASYRTMFALNFVATFALLETAIRLLQTNKNKNIFALIISCCFVIIAYRNFRFNFIVPLTKEYNSITSFFNKNYNPDADSIFILRPPENIFYTLHGVTSFNDEFGIASTFKDWTPEPLIKELIFEKTNNRNLASKVSILQFTEKSKFQEAIKNNKGHALSFDFSSILNLEQ